MHLEHRIPWNALDKVLKYEQHPKDSNKKRLLVDEAGLSVVGHFARCLHDAITEFESTDKSSPIERERYNIRSWKSSYGWPIQLSGGQGYLGSKMSVVAGYVKLNLLLLNWSKYRQILFSPSYGRDWVLDVCSGQRDGGHPEWLAQRMRAIWDSDVPPENTTEVAQAMLDHCKDLFRCMYTSGSDLFTASEIESTMHWVFGLWRWELYNERPSA
ncbi:hypothetical protein MIR68_001955 [Amoeboaphelidium protococcarum]|nr:hypothetical protein MIR68_001955 [Amoeboaphelidium protococcarum]